MTAVRALRLDPASSSRRIMDADEVAREKFSGKKSARWVRAHVPGRLSGSREALWFEATVDAYLATLRSE